MTEIPDPDSKLLERTLFLFGCVFSVSRFLKRTSIHSELGRRGEARLEITADKGNLAFLDDILTELHGYSTSEEGAKIAKDLYFESNFFWRAVQDGIRRSKEPSKEKKGGAR